MSTSKKLMASAGGGFVDATSFYAMIDDIRDSNSHPESQVGDEFGNTYFVLGGSPGGSTDGGYTNQPEYQVWQFDKDGRLGYINYTWRSDQSSSNSMTGAVSAAIIQNNGGTLTSMIFLEKSSLSSQYPTFIEEWDPSTFSSGSTSQKVLYTASGSFKGAWFMIPGSTKEDSNGNKVWAGKIRGNSAPGLIKFNGKWGGVTFQKYLTGDVTSAGYLNYRLVIDSSDNYYMVFGKNSYQGIIIVKFNSSGTMQWAKRYSDGNPNASIYVQYMDCKYNPVSDKLIMVYSRNNMSGNTDNNLIFASINTSDGLLDWGKRYYTATGNKSVRPCDCVDVDAAGNIYTAVNMSGITGPSGQRSSWGLPALVSVDQDGGHRYFNSLDPDGVGGSREFNGCQIKSMSYCGFTDTIIGRGELGIISPSQPSQFLFRVPADGSGTSSSTQYTVDDGPAGGYYMGEPFEVAYEEMQEGTVSGQDYKVETYNTPVENASITVNNASETITYANFTLTNVQTTSPPDDYITTTDNGGFV